MAKITRIGDKEKIIQKKKERDEYEKLTGWIRHLDEKELSIWCKEHFNDLPPAATQGLEVLAKIIWTHAQDSSKN